MTTCSTFYVLAAALAVAACGDAGGRIAAGDAGAGPEVIVLPHLGTIDGGNDPGDAPSTCAPPASAPDTWIASVHALDIESDQPVAGATVEVRSADDALLASATTDPSGSAALSVPTGGVPIDGSVRLTRGGYLTTRVRVQGGLGGLPSLDVPMARATYADAEVLAATGEARVPGTSLLVVEVAECNQLPTAHGVRNATVSLATAGAGVVYANAYGSWDPWLDQTTTSGVALAANVPAGDALVEVAVDRVTLQRRIVLEPDTWEVVVTYPRAPVKPPECAPGDLTAFEPTRRAPVGLAQGACTDRQIDELVSACFSGGSGCTGFRTNPANADCYSCAVAHPDSLHWNGIVDFDDLGFVQALPSQCIAAFEGSAGATSCGTKLTSLFQCQLEACAANCPIRAATGAEDMVAFDMCLSDARANGCLTYAIDADMCAMTLLGYGNPVDQCLVKGSDSFATWAHRELSLVCGDGSA